MVAAIGKMGEFGNHFRVAVTNGLTRNESRAVHSQITIYLALRSARTAFRWQDQIWTKAREIEGLIQPFRNEVGN
jgi:alkylhydroperoxidase/carboxymuconolactone decarboxylase family protein YurZ